MADFGFSADKVTIIVEADDRASGKLGGIGGALNKLNNVGMNLAKVGLAGVAAGIAGVGAVIGATLPKAIDFESSLAELKIAAGSADLSMDDLREAALAVGGDMKLIGVDASGAATAMTGLYKAGLDTTEIFGDVQDYLAGTAELGGALRASIDLAAASELDMVQASDFAAIALSTFGAELETAEERAEFVNFALDNTVRAADASVASVSDLIAAMINVGPMAAAMGIGIDDLNTALAILSTRGIVGAEAGTAFKSMLTHMLDATGPAADALNELGVELYDLEGNFRGLPAIIQDLEHALYGTSEVTVELGGRTKEQNELLEAAQKRYKTLTERVRDHEHGLKTMSDAALEKVNKELAASAATIEELEGITGELTTTTKQLTEEQRNQYIQTIAGTYGLKALHTLLAEGHEGWDQMIKDTADATGMMEQAAIKSETFAMKIEALTGVLETMAIEVGTPVLDFLSRLIDTVAGPGFKALEPFVEMWERVWKWFDNVFTLVSEHGWTFQDIFTTMETGRTILENFFKALGMAERPARALSQAINDVVNFIFNLWGILQEAATRIAEFMAPVWEWIEQNIQLRDIFIALGLIIGTVLVLALGQLLIAIAPVVLGVAALILVVSLVRQAWEENWLGIRDKLTEVWEGTIRPALETLWNWLQVNIPLAIETLRNWWDNTFIPALQRVRDWIEEHLAPKFREIRDWLQDKITAAIEKARDWWDEEFIPAMGRVRDWIVDTLIPKFIEVKDWLEVKITAAIEVVRDWWDEEFIPALKRVSDKIAEYLAGKYAELLEWLNTDLPEAIAEGKRWLVEEFEPALVKVKEYIEDPLIPILNDLVTEIADNVDGALEDSANTWAETYKPALEAVWGYMDEYVVPIFTEFSRVITGLLNLALLLVALTIRWLIDDVLTPLYELAVLARDIFLDIADTLDLRTNISLSDTTFWADALHAALSPITFVLQTIHRWLKNVANALDALPDVLPSWLRWDSPPPLELALRGINSALVEVNPNLEKFNAIANATGYTGVGFNMPGRGNNETHYHYHLGVNSTQSNRRVIDDFNLMRAMAG